ncbi:MAG: response regulator [Fibromonadaceae bacterium]|jgi:CheY-like chemotaxis protein|nr:response regulator [Fibromonadaceae bacterium]
MAVKTNNRILIMDDSQALLKVMSQTLTEHGYEVETALNGVLGLQKMETFRPGLAIIDIMMPEMDGYVATRKIRTAYPDVNIVMFSAQPAAVVEKQAFSAGADIFLQKPIREPVLLGLAKKYTSTEIAPDEEEHETILHYDSDQPYTIHIRTCYFCGCDHVNFFVPRPEAYEELWDYGLFPRYVPKEGFPKWDFMRTMVAVCPSCLFASYDINDFAVDARHTNFPYSGDAKRILSRGIASRKKMIGAENTETIFSNPNRTFQRVAESFLLAEKGGNGLVIGDKEGVYCDIGFYSTMSAVLEHSRTQDKIEFQNNLRKSLDLFLNQLKIHNTSRITRAKTYYFIITLNMATGASIRANEMKLELENYYRKIGGADDATQEERIWNERLLYIWKEGVNADVVRDVSW